MASSLMFQGGAAKKERRHRIQCQEKTVANRQPDENASHLTREDEHHSKDESRERKASQEARGGFTENEGCYRRPAKQFYGCQH